MNSCPVLDGITVSDLTWYKLQTCELVMRVALHWLVADLVVLYNDDSRLMRHARNRRLPLLAYNVALLVISGYGVIKHESGRVVPTGQSDSYLWEC